MSATQAASGYNRQQYQYKLRYDGHVHANLLALQGADPELRARGTTKSFGSIVNMLFGATYNQNELLRLLGSTRVQPEQQPAAQQPAAQQPPAQGGTGGRIKELEAQIAEHVKRREAAARAHQQYQYKLRAQMEQSAAAVGAAAAATVAAAEAAAARAVAAAEAAAAGAVAAAEGAAAEAVAAAARFAPAHHAAHNVTELTPCGNGYQQQKLRVIKDTVEHLIMIQGRCEPHAFWKAWYETNAGYGEFCSLSDAVARWDGTEYITHSDTKLQAGVRIGNQACTENLTQDKYKSLYINDRIGLHDQQHTLMLKLTGLGGRLKGITKVKEARKHLNDQVHKLLGFTPTPGGTGWQVDMGQLVKFITFLAVNKNDMCAKDIPDPIEIRITYDGAEVGGHPGIIAYLVPLNLLGFPPQSPDSAFPFLFCQCQESHRNLKSEMVDVCTSITQLETQGVEVAGGVAGGGKTCLVDWTQAADLASMWKQTEDEETGKSLTYNCNLGHCLTCGANKNNHHQFSTHRLASLDTIFHVSLIFPIPKHKTFFCCMHNKLRITEKLTCLLCAKAVELNVAEPLLQTIHKPVEQGGLGLDNVRIKKESDTGKVSVSTLYGRASDLFIANGEALAGLSGESNYKRVAGDLHKYGPTDPTSKTIQQIKKWATTKGVQINSQASKEELLGVYLDHTEGHVCSGNCQHLLLDSGGNYFSCPISLHSYTHTNRLTQVKRIWHLWQHIDSKLRQIKPLLDPEIQLLEQQINEFGDLYVEVYGEQNVTAYIHITCCHAVKMIHAQECKSLGIHCNQGVEHAHKYIRQLLNFTARGGGNGKKPYL